MGVSGHCYALVALYPWGKELLVPIGHEAGWAPEPVWIQRLEEKSSSPVMDRTPVIQFVVRHCTDCDELTQLTVTLRKVTEKVFLWCVQSNLDYIGNVDSEMFVLYS
jgi:hypothetical protein